MIPTGYFFFFFLRLPTLTTKAIVAASVLLVLVMVGPHPTARADATFTVKSNADTGGTTCGPTDCTLRQAINAANATSGNDTILFDLGQTATIELGSELPNITDAAGLTIDGGTASITVSGNDQVRVFSVLSGAKLTLERLTVADGFVGGGAGAIDNNGGTLEVTNSTFSENSAQDGGAIDNYGTLTVTNSTFSENSAEAGGAIRNSQGTLEITNSTFSGNSADVNGGAIYNLDSLTVTNSTFSGNSTGGTGGGGIFNSSGETATLRNTIMAGSTSGGNCRGTITDGGYNIDDATTCGFSADNDSKPQTDPRLDPNGLQNNFGPTQTIALQLTSPALNAIPFTTNGCGTEVTTDQRGVARPQFGACDIGSYELAQANKPNKDKKDKKDKKKHHKKKHRGGGGGGGGISQGSSQG